MQTDISLTRLCAFCKRLLQVCAHMQPPFVCGCLLLISEVMQAKPGLKDSILMPPATLADEPAAADAPPAADGQHSADGDSDGDSDSDGESDGGSARGGASEDAGAHGQRAIADEELQAQRALLDSLLPADEQDNDGAARAAAPARASAPVELGGAYDPQKREPMYSRADTECFWELVSSAQPACCACQPASAAAHTPAPATAAQALFLRHFHPSVRKFAEQLCSERPRVVYRGDPLADFTTTAFLDRFSFKKPKQATLQVAAGKGRALHARAAPKTGRVALVEAVNMPAFAKLSEERVPVDEVCSRASRCRASAVRLRHLSAAILPQVLHAAGGAGRRAAEAQGQQGGGGGGDRRGLGGGGRRGGASAG